MKKKLRTDKGLTQKQLADSLNVSQNAVYNGKMENENLI
ncbi:MAG: helix-turn-helix domain-containing protein [Enterocloster clostridioformis]